MFISHASEDKEDFVRPLAETLQQLGVNVWYDEFTLKVGDSLRQKLIVVSETLNTVPLFFQLTLLRKTGPTMNLMA